MTEGIKCGRSLSDVNVVESCDLSVTNEVEIIKHDHHEMHDGNFYFVKGWLDIDGAGTVSYFMFRTPNTSTRIHAKVSLIGEAEFTVDIYEGGTVSADGTPIPRFNVDRDSSNVSELVPFAAPTVTSDGTLIWSAKTGSQRSAIGVSADIAYEIIAKTNSLYLFKITKEVAGIHYIDYDFYWYEEDSP